MARRMAATRAIELIDTAKTLIQYNYTGADSIADALEIGKQAIVACGRLLALCEREKDEFGVNRIHTADIHRIIEGKVPTDDTNEDL